MRGCWSIVALIGFVMQQFVCCAATCADGPATSIEQKPLVKTCCGHHHHTEEPAEPTSSHHLCVATHLFFIERVADAEIDCWSGPILTAELPLCPLAVVVPSEPGHSGSIDAETWSLPAQARRSALGVWTL